MASGDKITRSDLHSDKFTGSPVAPALAPSTNTGQAASPSQTSNIENDILRAIVDQAVVGFVQADLAGRITFANDCYCEITGYPREELLGKRWHELTHPDDLPENLEYHWRVRDNEKPRPFEKRYLRKNGDTVWISIGLSNISSAGGETIGTAAFVVDTTERKHLEKEVLERRNEMAEFQKLHVAAQTAAAFAHELNQPLLAIASYSKAALILLQGEKPDLDKARKAIAGSELQAHRAGQSIRELLGLLSLKEFPTEVFDLNKEIIATLDVAGLDYELQFHSVLKLEEMLPMIRANRTHIQKVLLNLLHNCVEAMRETNAAPPSVTVTLCTIQEEQLARMTIQDNGPGFKKEDIRHLFEPFFTTKSRGIGMGLTISRSLVEANGGRLWVDPQEGPGATFHLTLPIAT